LVYSWDKVTKNRRTLKKKILSNLDTEYNRQHKLKTKRRQLDLRNKAEIFSRTKGLCSMTNCTNKAIQIHHFNYEKEGVPICAACHELLHPLKKERKG